MAKALTLTIKRESNGKTYEIPIMACSIAKSVWSGSNYGQATNVDKTSFRQIDDMSPIYQLLELPVYQTNTTTEYWVINNVRVEVKIKPAGSSFPSLMIATVNEGNNSWIIYSPYDEETKINGNLLYNSYSNNSPAYDYVSSKFVDVLGMQAFTLYSTYSNNKKIDYILARYYPDFFKHGTILKEEDDLVLDTLYQVVPIGSMIPKNDAPLARIFGEDWSSSFGSFMKWLQNRPGYDPIPVPKYPDDDDDPEKDDDDPTDPTPGDGDKDSDPIPQPPKPTTDVTGTGFVTLYNPSSINIRDLAYFMWTTDFSNLLKKIFGNPIDALIGLKLLYAPVTAGASQTIWLGNVETTVSAPKITDQFTDFDCGTVTLNGYFGSFLDYPPYTKVTIFLPFIGYKELNVDEVMNAQLHLTYRIDAYTGACIAFLNVSKTIGGTTLNSILYEFDGNAAMDIPFSSSDMSRYVAAILNTAASTALALASGGASAGLSAADSALGNLDTGKNNSKLGQSNLKAVGALANGALDILSAKPHITRGGSLAGANASMALKQPYLIIERPMQQMPSDYSKFIGIPLNMSKPLSQCTGYTVVSQIFMASATATDEELQIIDSLLKQGVII